MSKIGNNGTNWTAIVVGTIAALVVACSKVSGGEPDSYVSKLVKQSGCDERTAHQVGRMYFAVNPYYELTQPRNVEGFIKQNSALLNTDGHLIRCARTAAHRLAELSVKSFDARAGDDAYSMSLNQGATLEQATAVKDSINEGSVQTMIV